MESSNRTPGPWRIDEDYEEYDVVNVSGIIVASVYCEEDAASISAVPELLEACTTALEYLRLDAGGDPRPSIDRLRMALEKAKAAPVGFFPPGG